MERARSPCLAHALARLALAIAKRRRDAFLRARAQLALLQTWNTLGEFPDALALCDDTAARFERLGDADNVARVWLEAAWAETERGNLDTARQWLARAQTRSPNPTLHFQAQWIAARLLRQQSAFRKASALFQAWRAQLAPADAWNNARLLFELGQCQAKLDPQAGLPLLERARAQFTRLAGATESAWCDYYAAQCLMDLNRFDEAGKRLAAAQSFAAAQGLRFLNALCDLELGNLSWYRNDFETSLALQKRAQAIFVALGVTQEASSCEVNIGELLNRLNRYAEAIPYLQRALRVAQATGRQTKAGVCHSNLADSYGALGDYARAIDHITRARELFAAQKIFLRLAESDLNLGRYYSHLGQYRRAHQVWQRARRAAQHAHSPSLIAQADLQLAQAALQRGRRLLAQNYLTRAHTQFQTLGQTVYAALCERLLAQTQVNDRAAALKYLRSSRQCFAQQNLLVEMALCDITRGDLYRGWGEWNAAARAYQRAEQILAPAFPDHAWRAMYGLAKIAAARGEEAKAQAHYRRAAKTIATLRGNTTIETWSNDMFAARQHVFADALELAARRGSADEMLRLVESAKAQMFLQQLQLRAWRDARNESPETRALVERERALRQKLWEQRKQLMLDAAPENNPVMLRETTAPDLVRVAKIARAYENVAERLRLARHGLRGNPTLAPFSLDALRAYAHARWRNNWTALDYYFANGSLYVVCIDAQSVRVHTTRWTPADRLYLEQATSNHPDLRELVYNHTLHGHPTPTRNPTLTALAARLLPQSILDGRAEHTLIISPHAQLHQLPFHALEWRGAPLLEQFTIVYTPNLQALVELARAARAKPLRGQTLICGVESFANAPALAHTRREIQNVARTSHHATTLWQAAATREHLLELNQRGELARYVILHFATHATIEPNAPHASRILLADDELNVLDITGLRLDARLVTLSACASAAGEGGSGDEWLGLSRAFFYAGARAVVASLWHVDDASTAELMKLFYRHLRQGARIGKALRNAQLELRRAGFSAFHWAPFVAIGKV
jgi:CHAT domain-containing protein